MCQENQIDAGRLDFSTLDAEIAQIAQLLSISRECGFTEEATSIERDIVQELLPGMILVMTVAGGEDRAAITSRYRRLQQLLGKRATNRRQPDAGNT